MGTLASHIRNLLSEQIQSGKSKLAIYQDFHAKVFTKNLTAILAYPAQHAVNQQSQHKKFAYQINFTKPFLK